MLLSIAWPFSWMMLLSIAWLSS